MRAVWRGLSACLCMCVCGALRGGCLPLRVAWRRRCVRACAVCGVSCVRVICGVRCVHTEWPELIFQLIFPFLQHLSDPGLRLAGAASRGSVRAAAFPRVFIRLTTLLSVGSERSCVSFFVLCCARVSYMGCARVCLSV